MADDKNVNVTDETKEEDTKSEKPEKEPDTEANKDVEDKGDSTPENVEEKKFTQKDVDRIVKERLARAEKKKADTEVDTSQVEALTKRVDELIAERDAKEQLLMCSDKGVFKDDADAVLTLAEKLITDDVDMEKAIDEVLTKYPHFKATESTESVKKTKSWADNSAMKGKKELSDYEQELYSRHPELKGD